MKPQVQAFFDKATNTITYLVWDEASRAAALVDPVLDYNAAAGRISTTSAEALLAAIEERGLSLAWILETHAHADHLSAGHWLREKTGAPIAIGSGILKVQETFAPLFGVEADGAAFDRLLEDGETLPLGELTVTALHTPGHTPACVSYLIGDAVFVGDTLFMPDFGSARCDFPGGSARTLYRSIRRLLDLPAQTRIFVGHDYLPKDGRKDFAWETTVEAERAGNVHVRDGVDEEAFVALREGRDAGLPVPALLLPALQVNIRAGALPPPDPSGRRFLRIPVGAL